MWWTMIPVLQFNNIVLLVFHHAIYIKLDANLWTSLCLVHLVNH